MDALAILEQWLNGIKIDHMAHQRTAPLNRKVNRLRGVPVAVLVILIGTSIYGTLSSSKSLQILIVVGAVSVFTAVLSSQQTFLNYPELAQKHQAAGIKLGRLRRCVEEVLACKRASD